jgi:SAM-dependent methyltransferase
MPTEDVRARIESFPVWHYRFDLDGFTTPLPYPELANRHEQRRRYLFEPLVDMCGGSLEGKRVLDLGCNAGYWSLHAIASGADFVLGIDAREMHIEQASLVFEVKDVDPTRYSFELGNVFEHDLASRAPFDVVLCLGLLYHVNRQMELLERISSVNSDILVIDTDLWPAPSSYLRLKFEDPDRPLHAVDNALVMVPTKKAVTDMTRSLGYSVAALRPDFDDWTGVRRYRQGRRKAFICAKQTPLSRLGARTEPTRITAREVGRMITDLPPQIPRRIRKRRKRSYRA